ncbi:MAG TPA: hypothetical protein VIH90_00105 [Candidatus Saccharimonadales bacterium]
MSETPAPELGEPSADLKKEFCSVVEGAIPEGVVEASFTLEDGRVLSLSVSPPMEGDEGSGSHNASFSQKIQGDEGVITRHDTYYIVYQDGGCEKSIDVVKERSPADQASMDQLMASARTRAQELEAMGKETSEARSIAALELAEKREAALAETGYDPIASLNDEMFGSQRDKELGLDQVSGVEMQRVMDKIRSALAGTQR